MGMGPARKVRAAGAARRRHRDIAGGSGSGSRESRESRARARGAFVEFAGPAAGSGTVAGLP